MNTFSVLTISCLMMVFGIDLCAMDGDEWGAHKSKSFGAYSTSFGGSRGIWPAFLAKKASHFELDNDFDVSQSDGQYCSGDNVHFKRALSSPRFSEVSLVLHKTDKKFLSNLLSATENYQKLDQFFKDLDDISDEKMQTLTDLSVQFFEVAARTLDGLAQETWQAILVEPQKEKSKKEKSSRPIAIIPEERWKSQKGLMARRLNAIMSKIFTKLEMPRPAIKELISMHQSSFATVQSLSSSWNSFPISNHSISDE